MGFFIHEGKCDHNYGGKLVRFDFGLEFAIFKPSNILRYPTTYYINLMF
jgi:hypothetical protein